MKTTALSAIIFSTMLPISACVAQESSSLPIQAETLFAGQQCNLTESSSVIWVNGPQQLEAILKQTNSHMIAGSPPKIPAVNFVRDAVVAISMGQQRTGGYGLELSKSPMQLKDENATLKLNWRQPGKGMMTIQILTSPCILVKVPKGDYKTFSAITLTGKEIAKTEVK